MLLTHTTGVSTADQTIPFGTGGNSTLNPVTAFASTANFPGLTPTTQTTAGQLLAFMAGSVASASQRFYMKSPTELDHWTSYLDQQRRVIEPHENEISVFFKDNWKVRPSFTLNAGVRWQYYGVPYEGKGLTIRPQGGQDGLALFGVSGRSFSNWMNPNNGVDTSLQTQMEFVGPKTSNPGDTIFPNDYNNFGPAVGFAWEPQLIPVLNIPVAFQLGDLQPHRIFQIYRRRGCRLDLFSDKLLQSCRVIGRKVEQRLLHKALDLCRERGLQKVIGEYVPTSKSAMVASFYEDHGFTPSLRSADGRVTYEKPIDAG